MKKNQGIFEMWLKNFMSLVFTQSFQAIFLAVALQILAGINNSTALGNNKQMVCAIVAFISLTGVIKLQKLVKGIFGVEDSPLVGDMSKNMKSVILAGVNANKMLGGIKGAWGAVGEAKSKVGSTQRQIRNITQNRDSIERMQQKQISGARGNAGANSGNGSGSGSGRTTGYTREQIADIFSNPDNFDSKGNLQNENSLYDQMLDNAASDQIKAKRELERARSRAVVKSLSTIAGLSVAAGASDSIDETFTTGAVLAEGIDNIGNKVAKPQVDASFRKRVARELKANNNASSKADQGLKDAVDEATKQKLEKVKHDMDIINQAIIDSTKDISASVKVKDESKSGVQKIKTTIKSTGNKVGESVKQAADDWLNMQVNTVQEDRVKRGESKQIISKNRQKYGNKE